MRIFPKDAPIEKAIRSVGGKQKTLAALLGVNPQTISNFKRRLNGRLPLNRMKQFIEITGLSGEELYPEIFDGKIKTMPDRVKSDGD